MKRHIILISFLFCLQLNMSFSQDTVVKIEVHSTSRDLLTEVPWSAEKIITRKHGQHHELTHEKFITDFMDIISTLKYKEVELTTPNARLVCIIHYSSGTSKMLIHEGARGFMIDEKYFKDKKERLVQFLFNKNLLVTDWLSDK